MQVLKAYIWIKQCSWYCSLCSLSVSYICPLLHCVEYISLCVPLPAMRGQCSHTVFHCQALSSCSRHNTGTPISSQPPTVSRCLSALSVFIFIYTHSGRLSLPSIFCLEFPPHYPPWIPGGKTVTPLLIAHMSTLNWEKKRGGPKQMLLSKETATC